MNYLLIDANSIGRAAHASPKLTVGNQEVQAVFGVLRTLQRLLQEYPDRKPVVLWDGRAQWRFDLFPLYKGNRNDKPEKVADKEAYNSQKIMISNGLNALGVQQITDHFAEADDLAGYFSRKLTGKITLVTGDVDWAQLISGNVDWIDHRNGKIINVKNFKEQTGYKNPTQLIDAKALGGDVSDNIAGVGGIGDVGILELFDKFINVENFLNWVDSKEYTPDLISKPLQNFAQNKTPKPSIKWGAMLSMRDAYNRNLDLITLDNYMPSSVINNKGNFDEIAFTEFCEDLMFRSITRKMTDWIKPFKRLVKV